MAERRMFAKNIMLSDAFLDMSATARCLYVNLCMSADDDGFVNNSKSIIRQCGAKDADLKSLIAKKFVISFESGVIAIKHWRIHNSIRKDRKVSTKYEDEMSKLVVDDNNIYHISDNHVTTKCQPSDNQMSTSCQPSDNHVTTTDLSLCPHRLGEGRLGKDRLGKDRLGEGRVEPADRLPKIYRKDGSVFELTEQYILTKQKAYPTVNVMEEFWKIESKTESTPSCRPFMQNMDGFVNRWMQNIANDLANKNLAPGIKNHVDNDPEEYRRQGNLDGSFNL